MPNSARIINPHARVSPGSVVQPKLKLKIVPRSEVVDIDDLITEDDIPVDSVFAEKQQRLLTSLYNNWSGPQNLAPGNSFRVMANVGLFHTPNEPALAPDVMLSVNVKVPTTEKEKRSYFTWVYGKPPDVVIEIISDRRGGEDSRKLILYARKVGVPYYVILDPLHKLSKQTLLVQYLHNGVYLPHHESWLDGVELGLRLWQGYYEDEKYNWLRWIDREGNLIPTSAERAGREHQRSEQERQRAEQEYQRAEQERQRAEQECQRAEQESAKVARLAARLRELGIDPDI